MGVLFNYGFQNVQALDVKRDPYSNGKFLHQLSKNLIVSLKCTCNPQNLDLHKCF